MSTGTTQEWIDGRLKRLEERGLVFSYIVEDGKHWLISKHGYFGRHFTAEALENFLAGVEYGYIQCAAPTRSEMTNPNWVDSTGQRQDPNGVHAILSALPGEGVGDEIT